MRRRRNAETELSQGAKALYRLEANQRERVYLRFQLFAARNYSGRVSDPEGLATEIFIKVLKGDRQSWDDNFPPFENLCSLLRSAVYNQTLKDKRSEQLLEIPFDRQRIVPVWAAAERRTPLEILLYKEKIAKGRRLIFEEIQKDPCLALMVDIAKRRGGWDTPEIAKSLKVSRKQVYQVKRRLLRRLKTLNQEN